jgi:hypothetical protein
MRDAASAASKGLGDAPSRTRHGAARYFALALVEVTYALNFPDRTIFDVLIEPIKEEFALSDTTVGLLQVLALFGCTRNWACRSLCR